MRGFGGSSEPPSQYERGFVVGFFLPLLFIIAVRVIHWALQNPVIDSVVAWATTPQIAPVDILSVGVVLLIIAVVLVMNGLFGGVSR